MFNHYDTWAMALIDRALRAGHMSPKAVDEIRAALQAAARANARPAGRIR